ncbi:MAG: 1-phosphofructokinase [Mobilicoccus sp.]|nr:1-phosphofructokinase [Mobilicoccus sp.]
MIVTVTPNPSIDRTIEVDALSPGHVNRATSSRLDPGGKGINVSRALVANGGDSLAVLPIGGTDGGVMTELLSRADVPVRAVPMAGSVRTNVAVVEPDGTTTKVNEPGPVLEEAERAAFLQAVADAVGAAPQSWVVGCGSLPGGVAVDFYADLVRLAHDHGCRAVVDASGAPLAAALPAGPDLIKPNRVELGEIVGTDLDTVGAVVSASRDLIASGVGRLLVSLGRDGALLITAESVLHAGASVERPVSTVGAGDCTLAGFLLAASTTGYESDEEAASALSTAVAFGSAAVALPGTKVPTPEQVAAVHVTLTTDPDASTPLRD